MIWKEDLILVEDGIEYLDDSEGIDIIGTYLDTDVKIEGFLLTLHDAVEASAQFKFDFEHYHTEGRNQDIFDKNRGFFVLDELITFAELDPLAGGGAKKNDIWNAFDLFTEEQIKWRQTMFDRFLNTQFGPTEDTAKFYDEEWDPR